MHCGHLGQHACDDGGTLILLNDKQRYSGPHTEHKHKHRHRCKQVFNLVFVNIPMIWPRRPLGSSDPGATRRTMAMMGQLPAARSKGPTKVLGTTPGNSRWSYYNATITQLLRTTIRSAISTEKHEQNIEVHFTCLTPSLETPKVKMSWVAWRLKLSSTFV